MSSPGSPSVAVAVVNWNTAAAAARAAEAYLASEGVRPRVTVFDNRSGDAEREALRDLCPPEADLILAPRNVGYAAAVNAVLADAPEDLVCASNADVVPSSRMLAELAAAVLERPEAGVAGPVYEGAPGRYHARLPGPAALLLRPLAGTWGLRPVEPPSAGSVAEVEQPAGACLVTRTETWRCVGGFDEGYFLWYEDVDLARRLRLAGHPNLVVGSARAEHARAQSVVQLDEARAQALRLRSLRRYVSRHHPRLMPLAGLSLAAAGLLRVRLAPYYAPALRRGALPLR